MPYKRPYPPEFRVQAVRLFHELGRPVDEVAEQIGVSHQTLRNWIKQDAADTGTGPGLTSAERAELRELRKRAARLEQENAFLKKAASFFAAETDRSTSRRRSG
jgi:transposase